jgi:hypothetical protein
MKFTYFSVKKVDSGYPLPCGQPRP